MGIFGNKDSERFITVYKERHKERGTEDFYIVIDRVTGVNYLNWTHLHGGGITPLYDENGKVIVSKLE